MTTPPESVPRAPLDARQRRVLGVLIEKAKTTPAGYPMSVNAIVAGCNQKQNREPLTAYDDGDVEEALHQLCGMGVVSELDWLGRVPKFKHLAYDWLGVGKAELAVLAELLLRGPQPIGDLRARAARMEAIPDIGALMPLLAGLIGRGLVLELTPAGRGQVVTHGLYPAHEREAVRAAHHGAAGRTPVTGAPESDPTSAADPDARPAAGESVAAELARLRAEFQRLDARLAALERRAETGEH